MRLRLILALIALSSPALAEEPRGCDKFAWPIAAEQAALGGAERQSPAPNGSYDRNSAVAIALPLSPLAAAKLAKPPERAPKDPASLAGSAAFAAASTAGKYRVTLPLAGWIDLVQDGAYLKPTAFTGALDCPNVRKSVEFAIGAAPFVLQVSGVTNPKIALVLTRVD